MDFSALPRDFLSRISQFTPVIHQDPYPSIDPCRPENSLAGKVAIITGASRGIGARGTAPAFARAGAKGLVLVATDARKLAETENIIRQINENVDTLCVVADVSKKDQVDTVFDKIQSKFDRVDILVNGAGVSRATSHEICHEDPNVWWTNFEVNTLGTFLMSRSFLAATSATASSRTPVVILNMTSSAAYVVAPGISGYSLSKTATQQMSTHIAVAHPETVICISVDPGLNDTDMLFSTFRNLDYLLNSSMMVGQFLVWLAADPGRSRFLNGRYVAADWDVDQLAARGEEIKDQNLLVLEVKGQFGIAQFE